MNLPVDIDIIGPAWLAGLLVLSTHVPLGRQVIMRGIIFLDLAVAQIAGLAVMVARTGEWSDPVQTLVAYAAGITGALLLYQTERRWPDVQEAIIGTAFILAATTGMIVVATSPHGHEYLDDLLSGQILWVEYHQLIPLTALYAVVLILWLVFGHRTGGWLFYLLFAAAITASVQLVGVYLVFASLIIPALAARNIPRHAVWNGLIIGMVGYTLGLFLSAWLDLPAGPVIVWSLAMAGIAWSLLRGNKAGSPDDNIPT